MNELIYTFAVWLDDTTYSAMIHESYYMYNWIESTHVLTLMVSLGMLFLIDLRMLGYAFPDVPASKIAERLNVPMLIGFTIMFVTGILLFYAVPVRSAQSVWFRIKMVLLVACAINAYLFHKKMKTQLEKQKFRVLLRKFYNFYHFVLQIFYLILSLPFSLFLKLSLE